MEGRHVHPSTLYPGGVGTVGTIQLMTDYLTRLMRYVEFMKKVVPMHDDLFDFFYEALPGYEQVGLRRTLLGCWGSFQDPGGLQLRLQGHDEWGRAMFVTPGVVVDGKLVTNDLVDINLGIRILLGSLVLRRLDRPGDVRQERSAGQPGRSAPSVEPAHKPHPQKRDLDDKYSWVMSPRWFDGQDHLALDTGGGPLARLWSTALAGLVDIGYVKATGSSVQINLPKTALKGPVSLEWKIPQWSNTMERNRARTYFQAYAAAARCTSRRRRWRRSGPGGPRPGRSSRCRTRGSAAASPRRSAACCQPPHGDPGRQDRQLPPLSADPVEREPARHLRDARAVRGRRPGPADLRGERPGSFQGHRHDAHGAQLRSVPAVRRPHVPRRGQDARGAALADPVAHR